MKVLKFGGTSVGKPERMRQVADIVTSDAEPKIVVLSALSGTTNVLEKSGKLLFEGKISEATKEIDELYSHYVQFYNELLFTDLQKKKAAGVIDQHFHLIRRLFDKAFTEVENKIILAQGELLSTQLFQLHLEEIEKNSVLLPALDFMRIDADNEPDIEFLSQQLGHMLKRYSDNSIFITQGYICMNASHQIDNLKRGGSDYTASLIGAALKASIVQIWTDIDGMHNNDPRIVEKTFPIAELSFNEASELAYFGAKILHPSSILPAKFYNIPVQLKNTMEPDAIGTLITANEKVSSVKAIAAKDGIIAIKIKSTRMLLAYGFLRRIFEVFENYKIPIDMITTSEVAVSLTIENSKHLSDIVEDLNIFGEVTVDQDQTIVCIVGNQIIDQQGLVKKVFDSLENIPVRMISYGGSRYNISVLIETRYKHAALQALNKGLFNL
ncbi:MAG: aspartate kinase [Cyclobacteriaceae bacterium]|nr:aspartate kinase [Cyclobacteriaceae bacterium]